MSKWAICIATARPQMAEQWLEGWRDIFELHAVDVLIMQDADRKTILPRDRVYVWDQSDVKHSLGDRSWIIPRCTAACRSFVLWQAYKRGYDYYLSLDDDCYPIDDIFSAYERSFGLQNAPNYRYVDYADVFGYRHHVRGYPYGIRKPHSVAVQYGVWLKNPDYDAITMIENEMLSETDIASRRVIVPKYSAFTGCIMNAAITHKYLPAMYQLLMGKRVGYDRVEDIWSALIMKRIADHLEDVVVLNGEARVIHERASNAYASLLKELPAMPKNEQLWEELLQVKLTGNTPLDCYREIAQSRVIPEQSEAMQTWVTLFEELQ